MMLSYWFLFATLSFARSTQAAHFHRLFMPLGLTFHLPPSVTLWPWQ
jgi:hypothetical protein